MTPAQPALIVSISTFHRLQPPKNGYFMMLQEPLLAPDKIRESILEMNIPKLGVGSVVSQVSGRCSPASDNGADPLSGISRCSAKPVAISGLPLYSVGQQLVSSCEDLQSSS